MYFRSKLVIMGILAGVYGHGWAQAPEAKDNAPSRHIAMTCAAPSTGGGESAPEGFELAGNVHCAAGRVQPEKAGAPMFLQRALPGKSAVESFAISARIKYVPGQNGAAAVGFDAAPAKTRNTNPAKHILLTVTKDGFALDNQGTITVLLPVDGAKTGVRGSTDSGVGLGWVPPPAAVYDATMLYPGDGTLTVSLVERETPQNSYAFRLTGQTLPVCDAPCGELGHTGGLRNVEVDALAAADQIGTVAYAAGPNGQRLPLPPHDANGDNAPLLLRFPVAGNIWAWVPGKYAEGAENKWVLAEHGFGETGQMIQQQYLPLTTALFQQGYTIVSIQNTRQNCWGNSQCVADVKAAVAVMQANLSLAAQPYSICDSMGCFTTLNAVAQGVLKPRAGVLICGNTNLKWDFDTGGANAGITRAYGVSDNKPYQQATAGADPLNADEAGRANLVAVPWMLFSSPGDTVVPKKENTDAFAKMITDAGGKAAVVSTTGNHEDPSNFNASRVVSFFEAN